MGMQIFDSWNAKKNEKNILSNGFYYSVSCRVMIALCELGFHFHPFAWGICSLSFLFFSLSHFFAATLWKRRHFLVERVLCVIGNNYKQCFIKILDLFFQFKTHIRNFWRYLHFSYFIIENNAVKKDQEYITVVCEILTQFTTCLSST